MPRTPKFTPRKDEGRKLPWTVAIPPQLKLLGVTKKYFATKAEATGFASDLKAQWARKEEDERLLSKLPPGVTLEDAVRFYIEHHKQQIRSMEFDEAAKLFHESRSEHSPRTQEEIVMLQNRFKGKFGLLSSITSAQIQDSFEAMTYNQKKRYRRLLGTLFRWASMPQRGWCKGNPAESIEIGKAPQREIHVLTNAQVRQLLEGCGELMRPFFIIAVFTGARPSEIQRTKWEAINWEEKHIKIEAVKSGASRFRYIDLQPNAMEWLAPYRQQIGLICGEINFFDRHRAAREMAGIDEWPEDVCRHTFASNHLTEFGDITRLMVEMNHTTTKMLFAHYHRAVTKKAAKEFWAIRPDLPQLS